MSRIGKQFISIPEKVKVKLDGQKIYVDGPKGSLTRVLPSLVCCTLDENAQQLFVEKTQNTKLSQALFGLSRTLVSNMVVGVSEGFEKRLQITGVGYRAQIQGNVLKLSLGCSHDINLNIPTGLKVNVENTTTIEISGIEKDVVGLFASQIRNIRPPEPYNGKGVLYLGENIRRKAGKVGK